MFPFQQSCELSFQISNEANDEQNNDTEINHGSHTGSDSSFGFVGWGSTNESPDYNRNRRKSGGRRPKLLTGGANSSGGGGGGGDGNNQEKRIVHREIERQRRQEMATLYSSLRNLLPVDYVQGKRSISDHVMEASNYIKNMERKLKMMKEKREKITSSIDSKDEISVVPVASSNVVGSFSSTSSSSSGKEVIVTVERFSQTLEIKISTSAMDYDELEQTAGGFPLSRVLGLVLGEGLDVLSCVSTRVNRRLIHVIHTEANNGMMTIDPARLQQRIYGEICSF